MAGLLARLLGRRGAPSVAGHKEDAGETKKASQVKVSEDHLHTIHSGRFSSFAEPKQVPADEDTGPWFVGKTVGEIYQIRGVLGRGGWGLSTEATTRSRSGRSPSRCRWAGSSTTRPPASGSHARRKCGAGWSKRAQAMCRELGNKQEFSTNLGNQAAILYARGDLDGAMEFHKQEEAICRELDNKHGLQEALVTRR